MRSSGGREVEALTALEPVQGPIQNQKQLMNQRLKSLEPRQLESRLLQQRRLPLQQLLRLLVQQALVQQRWLLASVSPQPVALVHDVAYLHLACHLLTYSSHLRAYEDLRRRGELAAGVVDVLSDQ